MTLSVSQAWDAFCWQHADRDLALGRCSLVGVGTKHGQKAVTSLFQLRRPELNGLL